MSRLLMKAKIPKSKTLKMKDVHAAAKAAGFKLHSKESREHATAHWYTHPKSATEAHHKLGKKLGLNHRPPNDYGGGHEYHKPGILMHMNGEGHLYVRADKRSAKKIRGSGQDY